MDTSCDNLSTIMPSRKQYAKTGEKTYVKVGKRGQVKLVAKTVQPKPTSVPNPIPNPPPVVINDPVLEASGAVPVDDIQPETAAFEPSDRRKHQGKV